MKNYIPYVLTACLVIGFTFLAPKKMFSQTTQKEAKIEASDSATTMTDGNSKYVKGITAGRARSLVGGVLALISVVIGWRAKTRSAKTGAKIALSLGAVSIILSIIHLGTSAGAVFGSGSGKAGAIIALLLGVIGSILGALTLRHAPAR